MALIEGAEVARFVVRDAIVPAAPEDAQPFEGEAAEDGLVTFAGLLLLAVIRFSPRTFGHGLPGPLDEGLAKELGGVPPPVRPDLPAALDAHRGDAAVFLDACGRGILAAIGAEGCDQTRSQRGARTGQVGKQLRLRVRGVAGGRP